MVSRLRTAAYYVSDIEKGRDWYVPFLVSRLL